MWDTTEEVDALLGPCAVIMRRIGMWQPPGGEPAGAKLLVTAVLLLIMSSVIIGGFVKIIVDPPPDFDTTSEGLFTAACTFTWAVRVFSWFTDNGVGREALSLHSTDFKLRPMETLAHRLGGEKIVSILVRQNRVQQLVVDVLNMRKRFTEDSADLRRSYHRRSMIVCVVWMIFPLVGMPMWFVEPALAKTLITTPENTTIVIRKTPLLIWMPIDTQTHPNYEITYVFQLFMLATVVQVNVVVDLFFACLMVNVTADIAILNNIIANMRLHKEDGLVKKSAEGDKISTAWEITYKSKKPVAEKGEPYDENAAVQTQYDAEPSTQLYRTLVKNIQHHQIIMSIINDLESLMSESSVLMLGVNSVNICLQGLGFVDAFRPGAKRSTVLKKVLTFPAYINQTAHFCWYGQEIIDQSERLLESAFSCGWPEADKRFCSTLRIFMLQVSRPLKLQIGKVFTLSRNLFLQILNTSYTIFNMMINF